VNRSSRSRIRSTPEQDAIRSQCFHFSGKFVEFPIDDIELSVPVRFNKIVEQYGERLAVKRRDRSLTYKELNQAANRVSRNILDALGNEQEAVAVLFDQSVFLIAVLLGILKARKFYVPLDPSYPLRRNKFILEDSGARLIVTDTENLLLAQAISDRAVRVLNYDDMESSHVDQHLPNIVFPDDLAWLLYTSGTTGEPKGVTQNHRNVLHFIRNYANAIHVASEDRMSLLRYVSSFGATRDILAAVLSGAGLYLNDVRKEGVAPIANWLSKERITICFFGAPLFRSFLETLDNTESFPDLRLIRLGSDMVKKSDVERFQNRFSPRCVLVNGLSSTETGTLCKYFITKETKITTETVPVGYPVEDMEIVLVDDEGREIGPGEIGTITVKSRYLATGYWRRPELTDCVFFDEPENDGMRIYQTGDLGRMTPDGLFEHLGRKDFQVKVRGYRVETAEVERVLLQSANVKDVAVVLRNDRAGEARLVAYIVPAVHPGPTIGKLRLALNGLIPQYMIPSVFVMMDTLPLNLNGKVDRKALPDFDHTRPELDVPFIAPITGTEESLARIWVDVLGIDRVGIQDNFFDLGGDSLAATRVIARVLKQYRLELPLRTLFLCPIVKEMAAVITEHQGKQSDDQELERVVRELESLSEEEAKRLVNEGVLPEPKN